NKEAVAEMRNTQKQYIESMRSATKQARELADQRVKRALRITHANLVKQWDLLAQDGKQPYTPSIAEYVGGHILKSELEKVTKINHSMKDHMVGIVKATVANPLAASL